MDLPAYLAGLGLLALVALPLLAAGWMAQRTLLWQLTGAPALLAEIVVALALFIVVSELLGSAGAFSTAPLVISCVAVGGAVVIVGSRSGRFRSHATTESRRAPHRVTAFSVICLGIIGAVLVEWLARTTLSFDYGMSNVDTLWYHMPYAARFVQEGSLWHMPYLQADPLLPIARAALQPGAAGAANFHPANASIFHAAGIMFFGRDVLSPLLNLGWLALFLLAAFCVGAARGAGWPAAAVGGVAVAVPILAGSQPGEATNDLVGLFFLIAAVALTMSVPGDLSVLAVAGLAAGAAAGTKLTFVAPVLALTILLIAFGRRPRWQTASVLLCAVLAAGGYWYLRNWIQTGSPLPMLRLGFIGWPGADLPSLRSYDQTVVHYLTDGGVWRRFFIPGLHAGLGTVWPLLVVIASSGIVLALWRGVRTERLVGVVAIASIGAYLVTPQTGGGPEGEPALFLFTLRYLTPGLTLGMLLAPRMAPTLARDRPWPIWAAVVLAGVGTFATVIGTDVWPNTGRTITLCAVIAGAIVAYLLVRRPTVVLASALIVVVVLALPAMRYYLRHRYTAESALRPVYGWAQGLDHKRIAFAGFITSYPLYGPDASNRVDYVGVRGEHGTFRAPTSCASWVQTLERGHYDYAVLTSYAYPFNPNPSTPPTFDWTRTIVGSRELMRPNPQVAVFRLDPKARGRGCGR